MSIGYDMGISSLEATNLGLHLSPFDIRGLILFNIDRNDSDVFRRSILQNPKGILSYVNTLKYSQEPNRSTIIS